MRNRHLNLAMLALALGLGLTSAACGSDSDSSDGGGAAAADDGGGSDEAGSPGEAALEFAQCMRENGVEDYPDPEVGADGRVRITGGGSPGDPDIEAAQEACQPILDEGGAFDRADPEEAAEREAQVLAFAECMREHGIDFPDPEVDGGRVMMRPGEGADPESPEFIEAQEACEGELPDGAPNGPGGGSGGQP